MLLYRIFYARRNVTPPSTVPEAAIYRVAQKVIKPLPNYQKSY